jgi:hypothetical protein
MCQQCFHRNTIQTGELEGLSKNVYLKIIIDYMKNYIIVGNVKRLLMMKL